MRILLSTYGSRGDVEPLAALAVALQAQGAEAVVCAPPDQEFVDLLARAGLPFAPAFTPVREWIEQAKHSTGGIPEHARRMITEQYDAIRVAAQGCDAILATGLMPSAAAAQCVAETMGIPYRFALFCPLFLPSHHHKPFPYPGHPHPPEMTDHRDLWKLNIGAMNALFGEAVNGQRAALGLPLLDNVRDNVFTDRPFLPSDPALWPWQPTDLSDAIQTGAWILPDPRPLSADLEAFLEAGAPPVYVGFGSIALPSTREAVRVAIETLRALGRRVILARGWVEAEPIDGGSDVFLAGDVNQQALFRRVAAVVHHGGAGTTTTAARAGAPQAIVPQIVDQPFWAERIAGLGIGAAHDGPTPTLESLTAALEIALAPETRARASALSGAIRPDGAETAARLLLAEL